MLPISASCISSGRPIVAALCLSVLFFTSEKAVAGECYGEDAPCLPQCPNYDPCKDDCPNYDPCDPACPASCGIARSGPDADGDGVGDSCDQCAETLPCIDNVDRHGCPAEGDIDEDGVVDSCDNCPTIANADQADANGDGVGDACASAGSSMVYLLALDDSAIRCPWSSGDPADGQSFPVGRLTWEVRVLVSGIHSNPGGQGHGQAVIGAAAMLFDLELRRDTAEGALINISGQSWVSGNDLEQHHASFRPIFDLNSDGSFTGRLFDPLTTDGPGLTGHQYPSVFGDPAGATTSAGVLARMGAAYSSYDASQQAAGVGLSRTIPGSSCRSLGAVPIFEGQINTSGLNPGTYVLKCVPRAGNVLLGADTCGTADEGKKAQPANEVLGDKIDFQLLSPP